MDDKKTMGETEGQIRCPHCGNKSLERTISRSGRVALVCRVCGEILVCDEHHGKKAK